MTSEPYRQTFRVDQRARDLTGAERAVVEGRIRVWEEHVRVQARRPLIEGLVPVSVALATLLFGTLWGHGAVRFAGGVMTLLSVLHLVAARRGARARVAELRGPHHRPPRGDRAIETWIFARSVIGAVSGDHRSWLLFEIPGDDWFYLDPGALPEPERDLARAELHLVRLAPFGPYLSVQACGDPIPRSGASGYVDDHERAMGAGQVWRPPEERKRVEEGRVAEVDLPAWVGRLKSAGPAV